MSKPIRHQHIEFEVGPHIEFEVGPHDIEDVTVLILDLDMLTHKHLWPNRPNRNYVLRRDTGYTWWTPGYRICA